MDFLVYLENRKTLIYLRQLWQKTRTKKRSKKAPTELSTNAYNTPAGIEAARKSVLGDYTALLEVLRTKSNSVKYQIQTIDNFFDKYDRYVGVVQNINEPD